MSEADDDWVRLIEGLRAGNPQIAQEFCDRYGDMLYRVAGKHLSAGVRRRVEPEDVVQSACRTFFRRVRGGEFQLPDSESLWRLLCAITMTKVREQTRFHLRLRRGLDHEVPMACGSPNSSLIDPGPVAPGPTPAQAVELADQFQQLIEGLDEEERKLVDLKLQDYTNDEVATRMGCSERTIRRLLSRLEARLTRAFDAE